MAVTLYSFRTAGNLITVVRDDDYLNIINYFTTITGGPDIPQPPLGVIISSACQPGTFDRYNYFVQPNVPYARFEIQHNSPTCGYVPPTCDIYIKTLKVTPELNSDNDSASINMFAVSSYGDITYFLTCTLPIVNDSNTTGLFTNLAPGNYTINAVDSNSCSPPGQFINIVPFVETGTHFKYRLKFIDVNKRNNWELRLLDMLNDYDEYTYPIDITGATGSPIIKTTAYQSEDKTEPIAPTTLDVALLFTGLDFDPEEFTKVPEQSWKVELYKNNELDFQGWLLPDQTQDYYADKPYEIKIQATDGLPSLKGNKWGNGSGGQGYSDFQIQQYGLAKWKDLVKQCLDQLGYDYGKTVIISSLQFNGSYTNDLWLNVSTWSDILYDSSGVAVDTYTALQNLLGAFKLSIFQSGGRFFLVNWNDLSYVINALKIAPYEAAFYQFSEDWSTIELVGTNVEKPILQTVGYLWNVRPINPPAALNFDKPYNIEIDISFNILALLYENPSFEIGPVQGELPIGFTKNGTLINVFVNYDPVIDGVIGSGAYDGVWELKAKGYPPFTPLPLPNNYIYSDNILIDQINQELNISFMWKVPDTGNNLGGHALGLVYSIGVIFVDGTSNNKYFLATSNHTTTSYEDFIDSGKTPPLPKPVETTEWVAISNGISPYYSEGDAYSIKGAPITDHTGWQSFNITAPVFPESQLGHVIFRFYSAKQQLYDTSKWVTITGNQQYNPYMYAELFDGIGYVLYDQLNLTLQDASPTSTLQTGENHLETAVTGIPNANLKTVTQSLFTYAKNKRVAGNVFTTNDYLTGQVANLWSFATQTNDIKDRLPATIVRAIARNYSRPMRIFESDVEFTDLQFYSMFLLRFYDGIVFQPFSVMVDCRNAIGHIIIIEDDDSLSQTIYNYVSLYSNGARQNNRGV